MRQHRILFIEPKSPGPHIFSAFTLPRLGSILLATLARDHGWQASVIVEESRPIDWDEVKQCDAVGISTITSTAPRAYAIADRVRELGLPVVMGGPHVTFLTEEALQHADYVVRGEAEEHFTLLLAMLLGVRTPESVPGLSFRDEDGRVVHNQRPESCVSLDTLPYPDFSLVQSKPLRYGGHTILPVQTSRGCPFDCTFCSVTGMFGRRYRHRSTEHVMEELRRYNRRENYIFFYDDNFAASPAKTHELLDAMIAEKLRFKWSTQVRADVAHHPDLLAKMKSAGCHTVFIGFESVNPDTLREMKKRQSVEDIQAAVRAFRKQRIHVHGMFMLGLDGDTPKTVRETVRFARRNHLSSAQFMILTPLPGTRAFNELLDAKRITFHDWGLYDAHHVVYEPLHFTQLALQRAQINAHRSFYSLRDTLPHLMRWNFVALAIAHYARGLNRTWLKQNRLYLQLLKVLRPRPVAKIVADFHPLGQLQVEGVRTAGRMG